MFKGLDSLDSTILFFFSSIKNINPLKIFTVLGHSLFLLSVLRNYFLGHGDEGFSDVLRSFGRSFKELHSKLISEFLALLIRDFPLLLHIALVSDEDFVDVLGSVPGR